MEVDLSYGQLADFIFESNLPSTSNLMGQKLLHDVCNLMGLTTEEIHESCLNQLKQSLSTFCYTFRKKYKNVAYNKSRLRLLSWCSLHFKHTITQPELSGESSILLKTQPELFGEDVPIGVRPLSISRLELFQLMKESNTPISNVSGQTAMLCKHVVNNFQLVLSEEELLLLERRLRFFVLDVNKRFREKGIRQIPEHLVKKYTKTFSSFLSKDFPLAIEQKLDMSDYSFELFHESDFQHEANNKRMRLGTGRICPTNFASSFVQEKNLTKQVTVRRVGLSRLEKNIPKLHSFRV